MASAQFMEDAAGNSEALFIRGGDRPVMSAGRVPSSHGLLWEESNNGEEDRPYRIGRPVGPEVS